MIREKLQNKNREERSLKRNIKEWSCKKEEERKEVVKKK